MSDATPRVVVVGPGRMGSGIAQTFAAAGREVTLLDVKERPDGEERSGVAAARETVRSNLSFLAGLDRLGGDPGAILGRITGTRDRDVLADADWVFEALPEDPAVKTAFLETADDALADDAVVATTTSSISRGTLAPALSAPERLLITHWLNPAFIVPLVEVARDDETADDAVESTVGLLDAVGKEPVVCRDSPGFVGSRIQAAAMNEAVRVYEEGVADPADIDRALKTGVGFRMAVLGLLEFVDLGGVDILYYVNEYLSEELGPRFENPPSVVEKMVAGDLGPSTGTGYYEYDDVDTEALAREKYAVMLDVLDALPDGA